MSSSMLHLSLINLNFQDDPERLTQAKSLIKQLETKVQQEILGAVEGNPPKPIYLTFKGLQTPQYLNPT